MSLYSLSRPWSCRLAIEAPMPSEPPKGLGSSPLLWLAFSTFCFMASCDSRRPRLPTLVELCFAVPLLPPSWSFPPDDDCYWTRELAAAAARDAKPSTASFFYTLYVRLSRMGSLDAADGLRGSPYSTRVGSDCCFVIALGVSEVLFPPRLLPRPYNCS